MFVSESFVTLNQHYHAKSWVELSEFIAWISWNADENQRDSPFLLELHQAPPV